MLKTTLALLVVLIALLTVAACSGKPAEAPSNLTLPKQKRVVAVTIGVLYVNNETFGCPLSAS